MLSGLGIDVAAVAVFAFLYSRDRKASDAQVARLTREENLSRLKLRVGDGGSACWFKRDILKTSLADEE